MFRKEVNCQFHFGFYISLDSLIIKLKKVKTGSIDYHLTQAIRFALQAYPITHAHLPSTESLPSVNGSTLQFSTHCTILAFHT